MIDPILYPILEQATSSEDGAFISLGAKMIEWNNSCRLFLCTKLSNPSYAPEIIDKITLINLCIMREGLTDQLLNMIVKHKRSELE
jgi:dynein heavy chain